MNKPATVLIVALGLLVAGLIGNYRSEPKIVMLDIGQGDAFYIRTPAGQDILIDAGRGRQVVEQLANYIPRGDHTIDIIIASHMDADHIGGFKDVLNKYKVGRAFYNGSSKQTATAKNFIEAMSDHHIALDEMHQGQRISGDGFRMDILWPPAMGTPPREALAKKSNNFSIVSRVISGHQKILLTADLPAELEQELLDEHRISQVDLLEIPHHGSRFSSSLNMLKITSPDTFWISVGKNNRYGHPSTEVLERLKEFTGTIKRTDQSGSAVFLIH